MRFIRFVLVTITVFGITFCGDKEESSENQDSVPGDQSSGPDGSEPEPNVGPGTISVSDPNYPDDLTLTNLAVPEVLPPVEVNTPAALTIAVSASLAGYAIDCTDSYALCLAGLGLPEQRACHFIADVKCRFFGASGPTQFKQLLGNIDDRMAEVERTTSSKNIPCLDEANTEGYQFKDGDTDVVIDAFDRKTFSLKFPDLLDVNGEEQPLDLEKEYKLSCLSTYSNDDGTGGWSAIGSETGADDLTTYYLAEGNTSGIGGVTTVDSNDNIDYYGTVGEAGIETYEDIKKSNALIHLKSFKASGVLELSFTGVNVGPGCGMRMIIKGDNLYAQANSNPWDECLITDIGYDGTAAAMEFCLDVSGTDPATQDMSVCTAANLDAAAFSLPMLKRELFEATNIKHLFVNEPVGLAPLKSLPIKDSVAGSDVAGDSVPLE